MGGTLIRLVDQGHEVHVAYQTSGNIAVFDADAMRFADFAADFNRSSASAPKQADRSSNSTSKNSSATKSRARSTSAEVQQIKGLIRRGEARAAGRDCGVPVEHLHFMDLPFYETGTRPQKAARRRRHQAHGRTAGKDQAAPDLRRRRSVRPARHAPRLPRRDLRSRSSDLKDQAWCQGHAKSGSTAAPGRNGSRRKSRWPSRSAPRNCMRKRIAIFKHQSQKDRAMFPGADEREFWQRAEDRNRADRADLRPARPGRIRSDRRLRPLVPPNTHAPKGPTTIARGDQREPLKTRRRGVRLSPNRGDRTFANARNRDEEIPEPNDYSHGSSHGCMGHCCRFALFSTGYSSQSFFYASRRKHTHLHNRSK